MRCTKCNTEMSKGFLLKSIWSSEGLDMRVKFGTNLGSLLGKDGDQFKTLAYRCPNCKKVEIYTEDVEESQSSSD